MEYNESAVGQSDRSASNDAPTAMSESAGFADSAEPVATDPSGSTPVSGSDDRDFTTTNTQEKEVDEPDIVKNDADYVYVIRNGHLIIFDAWPATDASILSDTVLPGSPVSMFIKDDTLMVISNVTVNAETNEIIDTNTNDGWWDQRTESGVELTWLDLTDRSNPYFTHSKRTAGNYLSARRVDQEVLLVSQTNLRWPQEWETELDLSAPFSYDKNMAVLEDHHITDMLPKATATTYQEGTTDLVVDGAYVGTEKSYQAIQCENIYASDKGNATNIAYFQIFSVDQPEKDTKATGIVSSWSHLYASTDNAYMVGTDFHDGGYYTPGFSVSRVHKFATFQGDGAVDYKASGVFSGTVHNQFSMSEQDELFRVVVTENPGTVGDGWGNWNSGEGNETSLLVFEEDNAELLEIARVDDIGRDEVVQSVRFIGDRAYVVTYPMATSQREQIVNVSDIWDPLFVIDFDDPRNPKLRGELEVPGFSTYIHPLGDDYLLTVGENTDSNNVYLGMFIAVFDVSNPDKPTLAHREDFGTSGSESDALQDHHAFTFFDQHGILGIPIQTVENIDSEDGWWTGEREIVESGLQLFKIDANAETGIQNLGNLSQMSLWDDLAGQTADRFWGTSCFPVRRSVMIGDDTGVFVYALSNLGATIGQITEESVQHLKDLSFGDRSGEEDAGLKAVFNEQAVRHPYFLHELYRHRGPGRRTFRNGNQPPRCLSRKTRNLDGG